MKTSNRHVVSCLVPSLCGRAPRISKRVVLEYGLRRFVMKKLLITLGLALLPAAVPMGVNGADFFCGAGDVSCLTAAINDANKESGEHTITLEPGTYTLQAVYDTTDGKSSLPSITGSILIRASSDDASTIVELARRTVFDFCCLFHVSPGGQLTLDGLTVQELREFTIRAVVLNRGVMTLQNSSVTNNQVGAPLLRNLGVMTLQNSIVMNNELQSSVVSNGGVMTFQNSIVTNNQVGDRGAVFNSGTLNVLGSIISHTIADRFVGGIYNSPGGKVLVENSTIFRNSGWVVGGIFNDEGGFLVIKNSALISNNGDFRGDGALWSSGFSRDY